MSCYYRTIVRCVVTIFFSLLFLPTHAQWTKSEALTGGSIAWDIIKFNGDVYVAMASAGIFKSTDDGATWTQVAVPPQPNPTHFAISGSNLLAISYGMAFSTSDGAEWKEGEGPDGFVNDVGFDGSTNIFVATHNGIYQSDDAGVTWVRNADTRAHARMKSVAVKGSTVLAGTDVPAGGTLLKSEDGGTTWTMTSRGSAAIRDIIIKEDIFYLNLEFEGIDKSTDLGVNWQRIRNTNGLEGILYAGPSTLYYLSRYKLYTSSNAGGTWVEKQQMIPFFNASALYATEQSIFAGLWGGGIVRTTNTSDADWELMNNGIAVHAINDLEVAGSTIYAGLENSFVRSSNDDGLRWDQKKDTYGLFAGSGRAVLSTNSALFVGSGGGGVQRSQDHGSTWTLKNNGLISQNVLGFETVTNAIFVATDDGVYKSVNLGDTWAKKTGEMAMLRTLYSHGPNIYAGTYDGLFHSTDLGETWKRISTGLPDESIGAVVHMDSVIYSATQFNGLFKSKNHGDAWEKVSDEHVRVLAERNGILFMGTVYQKLLVSYDSGRTAEDVGANLPSGSISAIDFTEGNILLGKANSGLWTRKLSQVIPAHLTLYSSRNDNKFFVGTPIMIESDQPLYASDGTPLSEASTNISVSDTRGNLALYSVDFNAEKTLITLNIIDASEGETFTISLDVVYNESGLGSPAISRTFSATDNHMPNLVEASVGAKQGQIFSFTPEMFSAAFIDTDGDPLAKLMVKGLPSHGKLKLGGNPVVLNQEIPVTSLHELSYTPANNFSGKDFWFWNASDGLDYSASDVRMSIDITVVTSVYPELSSKMRFYPNPVSSKLNIEINPADVSSIDVFNVVSGRVKARVIETPAHVQIDFTDLLPGIYIVRIQSGGHQTFHQKIIRQ